MRLLALILASVILSAEDGVFAEKVAPVFQRTCRPCHDAATRTSGFSVATADSVLAGGARLGVVVRGGDPAGSVLVKILRGQQEPHMPLGKPRLAEAEIQAVEQWIAGVKLTEGKSAQPWAFTRPHRHEAPAAGGNWARNTIDRFIAARLEPAGLKPSPEAPALHLTRRLYADLIGVPPTVEELRAAFDSGTRDYDKLVDRLLDDPRFGERWGRHWLDLARYADTQGFEADRENLHMWRYRDYVIDAFQKDKPYDQFIREQLAGDELGTPEGKVATGFLRLGPRFQTTNAQEFRQMTLDELTATTGSVFLGLTVKCAQCHDHRYDPLPQRDFYRLQAFFNTIEMTEAPLPFADRALRERMDNARQQTALQLKEAQQRFDEYQKLLLDKLEASGVKLPAGDRPVAGAALAADEVATESFTRAVTPKIAALESRIGRAIANGVVPNAEDPTFTLDEKKKYLELLSYVDGNRGGRDMGTLQRDLRRYAPTAHTVRNIANDPNRPALPATFIRLMGEFNKPGAAVEAGFLSAVEGHSDPARLTTDQFGNPRGWRLPLAQWIASPDNPLTARVMVNRVWQHLFGNGLVATPSDFGRNGAPPTHPELLDWLATEFVRQKWSVKSLIRVIVQSAAYRQSSLTAGTQDPDNLLLWRQNRRRLEGEIIRDKVLAVSGALNAERGGPGVFIPLPEAMRDRMTIKNFPSWIPTRGPEANKRSVYVFQRRQLEIPLFGVMDAPVFQTSCDRRPVSTTPLQALTLMNDDFTVAQAGQFAARVRREAGPDAGEQVEHAFRLALSRPPDAAEKAEARKLSLESICRALFNANEFVYVD